VLRIYREVGPVTHRLEVLGDFDPFSDDPQEDRTIIQVPWWDDRFPDLFWPAVNAPTYAESAVKVSELVNYVYVRAHQEGVRSILGRDS
jgi:hypothetical protein